MDSTLHLILFDLLMFEKEPSSKDFNCTQGRIIVTISEVPTKEEITELKEIHENRLDTDHKSEKFDMSLLIKKLEDKSPNLKDVL